MRFANNYTSLLVTIWSNRFLMDYPTLPTTTWYVFSGIWVLFNFEL